MKKTLQVCYSGSGGSSEVCLSLAEAASAQGERHSVAFYGAEAVPDSYGRRCESLGLPWKWFSRRGRSGCGALWRLMSWMGEQKADVIITHTMAPIVAFQLYRLKKPQARLIVVEHHSNELKSAKRWMFSLLGSLVAHRIVFLTPDYRDRVREKLGILFPEGKATVVPNGLDTKVYSPGSREVSQNQFLIGAQGRLVEGKDFALLIRTFARLRRKYEGLRLEIAGDGPERSRLRELGEELGCGDALRLSGFLRQEELIERMRDWDVFVLPTHGETMSRAVMEAQAIGLPVVASEVSGVREAVEDGVTGLLVRPGSEEDLERKLERCIEDHELRERLGTEARRMAVERFSLERSWQGYAAAIGSIV